MKNHIRILWNPNICFDDNNNNNNNNKQACLKINGKQSMKLRSGLIKFNNCSKQLATPFKIYADFESVLKWVRRDNRGSNVFYTEKYQEHIPCSFAYKVVYIDEKFSKPVVLCGGEMQTIGSLQPFLKSIVLVDW